jgi:hypothetical protein
LKWPSGRDADPKNRHYCVIERWEYRDIFNRVSGHRVAMIQADSLRLGDMSRIIKEDITNSSLRINEQTVFNITEQHSLDLDYFIKNVLP